MCWSCRGPVGFTALFCHTCGAVQPPSAENYFAKFGLAPAFEIDNDKLEKLFISLQQRLHPDRFMAKSSKERLVAQSQTASLNDAYETLSDPLRRALYLLEINNYRSAANQEQTIQDKELLMEIMEQREELMEAQSVEEIEGLGAKVGAQAISLLPALAKAFAKEDFKEADRLSIRLKYLRKFLTETRERLSVMAGS